MQISKTTTNYLASKGVLIDINAETGFLEPQKIDDPNNFALSMELHFIPPSLKSDDEAYEIVCNISDITLDDETISSEIREVIIEDCWDILSNI